MSMLCLNHKSHTNTLKHSPKHVWNTPSTENFLFHNPWIVFTLTVLHHQMDTHQCGFIFSTVRRCLRLLFALCLRRFYTTHLPAALCHSVIEENIWDLSQHSSFIFFSIWLPSPLYLPIFVKLKETETECLEHYLIWSQARESETQREKEEETDRQKDDDRGGRKIEADRVFLEDLWSILISRSNSGLANTAFVRPSFAVPPSAEKQIAR